MTDTTKKIYEDEIGIAIMSESPATLGHVQIFPKRAVENYNDLTDDEASHLFYIASFAATAVFESLGAQGTNIIMQSSILAGNEFNKLCINVLPRKMDDGINFKWDPKRFTPEEFKEIEDKIKDQAFYIGKKRDENDNKPHDKKTPIEKLKDIADNYMLKQLNRIP